MLEGLCGGGSLEGILVHHVRSQLEGDGGIHETFGRSAGAIVAAPVNVQGLLLEQFIVNPTAATQGILHDASNRVHVKGMDRGMHRRFVLEGLGRKQVCGRSWVVYFDGVGFVEKATIPVKERDSCSVPVVVPHVEIAVHDVAGMNKLHRFQQGLDESLNFLYIFGLTIFPQEFHDHDANASFHYQLFCIVLVDAKFLDQIRDARKGVGHRPNGQLQLWNIGDARSLVELSKDSHLNVRVVQIGIGSNLGNNRPIFINSLNTKAHISRANQFFQLEVFSEELAFGLVAPV